MNSEHQEQCAIFEWALLESKTAPELNYMFSTLNGIKLTIGSAVKAKKSGNKKGVPDIVLPCKNKKYGGLYIELKVGRNKASKHQIEFIEFLRCQGYRAEVVYGAKSAISLIKEYINDR